MLPITCLRFLPYLFFLLQLLAPIAFADEIVESSINLRTEEIAKLKVIIAKPINPDSLNSTKTEIYREKDAAAFKLGDVKAREEILREWVAAPGLDSNIDARWTLSGLLFQTESRKEAYAIGEQLIKDVKGWPPSDVRIRTHVAQQYINDNNLVRAKQLLDEAEVIILNQWGSSYVRGPTANYWKNRAELEFYRIKATYLNRIGKWNEGLSASKKATESGIALLRVEGAVDDRQKNYGRIWGLNSFVDLAQQQITAGMYAQGDLTLRDTYALVREYDFSDKQLNHFYNVAADLNNSTGHFGKALKYVARSEKISEELGFKKGSSNWMYVELRKLRALIGENKWKEALTELSEIDVAVEKVNGNTSYSKVPYLRGYIYFKNGKFSEAAKLYESSLKWNVTNYGENHYLTSFSRGMYAAALSKIGEPVQALKEFNQAVKNIISPDSLSGDFVEDALRKKYKKFILESYIELLVQNSQNSPTDYSMVFEIADILNSSAVQQSVSDAAIRTTTSNPKLAEIIREEQDAKNEVASLNTYIIGQSTEGFQKRNIQVLEQMRKRLNELQISRAKFKDQIQNDFPEYYQLIQPKAPPVKEIASTLKADELFISILPLENSTYIFAIDGNGSIKFHRALKGEAEIASLVQRIRKTLDLGALNSGNLPAFDFSNSFQLYQLLLAPIENFISGKKHLIVSTSGSLSSLPFAVLISRQFVGNNLANAPWLINNTAISYMPSASGWISLGKFSKSPSASQPLIAWGDPKFDLAVNTQFNNLSTKSIRAINLTRNLLQSDYDRSIEQSYLAYSKLPQLPETRDEVVKISKSLLDSDSSDLFLGTEATRESVLKSNSSGTLIRKRVVVFATHGLRPGDLPGLTEPALAMAATPNQSESPLLTLQDIMGLRMNADWTVLSACNTAGADGKAGEALSGLARGFFFAGSRSLLVTHWSVESESATLITTRTFDAYKKDQTIRRADSLRLAMIDVMKDSKYSHPAFWAPYVLVGDGGR